MAMTSKFPRPIELPIALPCGPGPRVLGRAGLGLAWGQQGWWVGGLGGLGKLPAVRQSYLQSGKPTHCQAKLPTVRQAKDRYQAKRRQSGMHQRVSAYMHPTSAYFAPNSRIFCTQQRHTCTQPLHRLAPNNRIHAPKSFRIHAPNNRILCTQTLHRHAPKILIHTPQSLRIHAPNI